MKPPLRAKRLVVELEYAAGDVRFGYHADDQDVGVVTVSYPFALSPAEAALLPVIGLGVATYLGALCVAETIELLFPATCALVESIRPIAEMLYDVRRWKDGADLVAPPRFVLGETAGIAPSGVPLSRDRSLLLFSGGKDSTLAGLKLAGNGFRVDALHVTANAGVEDAERQAVRALGAKLGIDVSVLGYEHAEFRAFSNRYAIHWDSFPLCNRVPFGRDLVLALLALPVLVRHNTANLSFGHDSDCRNAAVSYQGKTFPRNDVESAAGAVALERYIRRFAVRDVKLLPPLAGVPELLILRQMFERHPEFMREAAFCFWGGNCGRCAKCLRYFLAQRLFDREGTLHFAANPLFANACPELDHILAAWGHEEILFGTEVVYALGRLVERGDVRQGEESLERFRATIYADVRDDLNAWGERLEDSHPDPQVPPDFIVS